MLTTHAGISTAISAGQYYKTSWNKTTAATWTAGFWYNTFILGGQPSAGSYTGSVRTGTPLYGCAGTWGVATPGKISYGEGVGTSYSGNNWFRHLLDMEMNTVVSTAAPAWLMLVDLLMYYPGLAMDSAGIQTLTNNPLIGSYPLPRYSNGSGVQMFLEVTTVLGGTGVYLSSLQQSPGGFLYTDANGNTGNQLPGQITVGAAAGSRVVQCITHSGLAANTFGPFIPLAANNNTGVQSVQSFQITATTGTAGAAAALVLCKPLATIPLISATSPNITTVVRDYIFNMPGFPQIYDGACLAFLICPGAAAVTPTWQGTLDFVWG